MSHQETTNCYPLYCPANQPARASLGQEVDFSLEKCLHEVLSKPQGSVLYVVDVKRKRERERERDANRERGSGLLVEFSTDKHHRET